ncbi:MAG TPA: trehalose-phosphatase [Vicinamibacteria bacterium]|nr:trehalose-phosphatase [Vicinamibacteria bacterium]
MRYILARANRDVLEAFACSNMLLALDFDGTLAPIVPDPARAALRGETRRLLRRVTRERPCVVISGRARSDVRRRLVGTGVAEVIGNHGLEPGPLTAAARRVVEGWIGELRRGLGGLAGVAIEDKGLSLAVHYRGALRPARARARVLGAAAALRGARLIGGKRVVNLLPAGAANKGRALEEVRARFRCDTALYIGDDETDEDVFVLDQPGRLLSIRVGRHRASAARYFIRQQREIDGVLRVLLASPARVSGRFGAVGSR